MEISQAKLNVATQSQLIASITAANGSLSAELNYKDYILGQFMAGINAFASAPVKQGHSL